MMENAQQHISVRNNLVELHDTGRELEQPIEATAIRQWLIDLLEYTHAEGMLSVEGMWRLDSRYARRLTQRTGDTPAGGWAGLAACASGGGILRAKREGLVADMSVCDLVEWTEADARRHLLESFTERLVPPAVAAGLFILIGIHPAWGLRIAHRAHEKSRDRGEKTPAPEKGWTDETLFPQAIADAGHDAVFGAIAAMVGILRSLEGNKRYDIGALSNLLSSICGGIREEVERSAELSDGLDLFPVMRKSGGAANCRCLDFCMTDLLDGWLVPAGAAQRFNDSTFAVRPQALEDLSIGGMEGEEVEGWFRTLLGPLS